MATRPLAFGLRLRDKGRTVRVRASSRDGRSYVVEDSRRDGSTRRRDHASLAGALRDAAARWRSRLH